MANLPIQSRCLNPHVVWMIRQFLVVCSHIDDDRQDTAGMESTRGHIEIQFADGNPQTSNAQVSQSQNTRAVRHNDHIDSRHKKFNT